MTQKISEFKIGNILYDVVMDGSLMDVNGALGSCDYVQSEIALYDRQSEQRMEQVLYHELTHAIFFEAGFDEQDEDMINRLGIVLHQFMTENFEFVGHPGIRDAIAEMAAATAEENEAITRSYHKQPMGFDVSVVKQADEPEENEVESGGDEV